MNERLAFSLFFQSPTHKWTLNDRISPPHSSFVGRRRGEVYKEGKKKWKLLDSKREIPGSSPGWIQGFPWEDGVGERIDKKRKR